MPVNLCDDGPTHLDESGRLRMVDVGEKDRTVREARAEALVRLSPETLKRITEGTVPKGNVFEAARLAGIMAAKRTWELIPLCHTVSLTGIEIEFSIEENSIRMISRVGARDRTGVEMEALVAVTHAALTLYDMCKSMDRDMVVSDIRLTYKSGGRSGVYQR